MTRATPAVAVPAAAPDVPAPVDAAPDRTPSTRQSRHPWPAARTAGCAALTGAAVGLVATRPAPTATAAALALSALVVGWGGLPVHRAAWAALRRGRATADVLPAAGVLAALAATGAAAAGPAPSSPGALVTAAAATTLLLAGRDLAARVRRWAEAVPSVADGHRAAAEGAVARARRGAVVIEQVADRAAGGSTVVVAALAVGTLGFWLGAGAAAGAALGAAAAVLLAACPRAAGPATSAALLAATGRAAELGAVPAGPRVLERAARVDTLVLCRTGTVTGGARGLRAVHAAAGVDADEALRLAGAVAAAAQEAGGAAGGHPVGALVAREARARFGALPGVAEFDGYPGLGVRGVVTELRPGRDDEQRVIAHATLVGRPALLAGHGIALPPDLADAVGRVHATGATAVAVSWDGVARAVLEVADPLRSGSAEAVRQLHGLGIAPVLLTGDDADAARGLAAVLGVAPDGVLARVARGDRAAAVTALRAQGRTVAVLGGPDDAAALAAADVALLRAPDAARDGAVGATGVPPGFVLRDGDPLAAVDALRLARRAARTVERGLAAGVAYHLAALPAAAAGLLPPLAAAALAAAHPVAALVHAAALRRVRASAPPAPR
jgi:Cu+-exporting ATPase